MVNNENDSSGIRKRRIVRKIRNDHRFFKLRNTNEYAVRKKVFLMLRNWKLGWSG